MKNTILEVKHVQKYYGDVHALKDFSLDVYEGEFLTLLGPSGCGKTTLLRAIAGFEVIDKGDIQLHGQSVLALEPNKRSVNTVFQNYALFPHLNVYENILYGPKVQGENVSKEDVDEVLRLVQMQGYEKRMPDQLSGGQKQRIAIARALINKPDILLLDEPLGALDLKLRRHMQYELSQIQKETETTFIYVTHDQEEALNMSDRLVIMNQGEIMQVGTPKEVYQYPQNAFVADFVGERNIVEAKLAHLSDDRIAKVSFGKQEVQVSCKYCTAQEGADLLLAIHADKMHIHCKPQENALVGILQSRHYAGSQMRFMVEVEGQLFQVVEYSEQDCPVDDGDRVYLTWEDEGAVLIPKEDAYDRA